MKKNYLSIKTFVVLLCLITSTLGAQIPSIATVGTGTNYNTYTGYPSPFGNWYWGSTHQFFITAAELSTAGLLPGGIVNAISYDVFAVNNAAPHQAMTVKIYGTASADPLVSGYVTTGLLASGAPATRTPAVGWNQFTVTPFVWNGIDNLVIETCHQNGSFTENASTKWTDNLTGTSIKSRYFRQDAAGNCGNTQTTGTSTNTRPNIRFDWINNPCTGTPAANSVLTPTYQICAGTGVNLSLTTPYTGLTYQWQSSITQGGLGPWTPVASATLASLVTPTLSTSTYFSIVIGCNVGGSTVTTTSGLVQVAATTTNNVAYNESFEGVANTPNKLPNCSWAASNMGPGGTTITYTVADTQGRTPHTGNAFASFFNSPAGANYFYSNGVHLDAGVTYSASLWYQTEYFGYNNWTDLSILVGTTQSPTGLTSIVSTNGPAVSNIYKKLSGNFTVPTSGLYYIAVRGTAVSGSAPYLSWDDLSVGIPCDAVSPNSPVISLLSNTTTICEGESITITASGADTFTWSTGDNTSGITVTPSAGSYTYMVMGTSALSGCTSTISQNVLVNVTPAVFIAAASQSVCVGSSVNLQALGSALSYTWSNNVIGASTNVSPTTPTTYSLSGTGVSGCIGTGSQLIGLYPAVNVIASSSRPNDMCVNETAVLTAVGTGVSFAWTSNVSSALLSGNPVSVSPSATSIYTVVATDGNGCQKMTTVTQNVNACTGISEHTASGSLNAYPNPTSGDLSIETGNALNKNVEVVDLTGKVVASTTSSMEVVKLNISALSNGIYYVKIQSNNTVEVIKVVKQ